jgi:tRNA G18 (ribose-2'-O)-methylase SpoU
MPTPEEIAKSIEVSRLRKQAAALADRKKRSALQLKPRMLGDRPFNIHPIYQFLSPEKIAAIARTTKIPCRIMTWNVNYNLNVGNIVRTAACFAFEKVYIINKVALDRRAMVGAQNYISLIKLASVNKDLFTEEKIFPIFIEQKGIPLEKINLKHILSQFSPLVPCLIMGAEDTGIPKTLMKEFPDSPVISITQLGMLRSLNVNVCAGIVMHALQSTFLSIPISLM